MTACNGPDPGLDICPTAEEITPQLIAMLPRGRAWSTHDGGPYPGTPAWGFWRAVAAVWADVNAAICAMAPEFFCASQTVTHDVWLDEYGLPDGCDPFPDLCAKVAAVGGARCEYITAIAARAGWAVSCYDTGGGCGGKAGRARAGCAQAGRSPKPGTVVIRVDIRKSPAFLGNFPPAPSSTAPRPARKAGRAMAGQPLACVQTGGPPIVPRAGRAKAGGRPYCPPDITGIACIVERISGAHNSIVYEVAA
jgi:hypothetical protein